jgi:hypothetical protein
MITQIIIFMKKITFLILVALTSLSLTAQTTYYVKPEGGKDSNDGKSWTTAYATFQKALDRASAGSTVWVAKGTYTPSKISGDESTDNRDKTFEIPNGVLVYGGFAGTEKENYELSQRNFTTNQTILTGDIDSDGNSTNNAYHVVVIVTRKAAVTLDGFTITEGSASGVGMNRINGMSVPRVYGGGVYLCANGKDILLNNNDINKNQSTNWGGGAFINSTNTTGGVYFIRNIVRNNTNPTSNGAGLYAQSESTKIYIVNNLVYGNYSAGNGVGVYINSKNFVAFINNTVVNNKNTAGSNSAGAVYFYLPTETGVITMANSIVYGNIPNKIASHGTNKGTSTVSHSIIEGGYDGVNILDTNPLFTDATKDNYTLAVGSPAINVGDKVSYDAELFGNTDQAGKNRFKAAIDLGAYEFTTK